MKAYLWYDISYASDSYHTEGTVLIEAATLERARELGKETDRNMTIDDEPTKVFKSNSTEEKVWVFPNAGCC